MEPRHVADLHPALGVRVVAGPLELRGITDDLLPGLGRLARDGIHDPNRLPFYVPWSLAPADELPGNVAAYHWRARADFSPAAWTLNLAVLHYGVLVGSQGLSTKDFLVTRTGETGSWLGRAHQGRGIGTAMRQAICALAFDHLGFEEITSSAFTDNPASLAVSRKLGYRPDGVRRFARHPGELAYLQQLTLTPGDFVRGEHPVEVEGVPAYRRAIGLD